MNCIANELRRLREHAGLSTRDLALRMHRSQSFVAKVERGDLLPSQDVVQLFTKGMGVDGNVQARLRCLSELVMEELRGKPRAAADIKRKQSLIKQFEQIVTHKRVFALTAIPGLLQTREYASILYDVFGLAGEGARSAIDERISRATTLLDKSKRFEFVIADSVLRSSYFPEEVMSKQIDYLREISSSHSIAIIQSAAPEILLTGSSFSINDNIVVCIEGVSGQFFVTQPQKIKDYVSLFKRFQSSKYLSSLDEAGVLL